MENKQNKPCKLSEKVYTNSMNTSQASVECSTRLFERLNRSLRLDGLSAAQCKLTLQMAFTEGVVYGINPTEPRQTNERKGQDHGR